MPEVDSALLIFLAAAALSYVYAFLGGFTDAANAIATAVGTRAFTPLQAVLVAATCEILGALTGTAVALTIGTGIVPPELITQSAVASALLGAMTWSLYTYFHGIPVSETHGLIGGIIGVGLFSAGIGAVEWRNVIPVLAAVIVSPLIGFLGGFGLLTFLYRVLFHMPRARAGPLFLQMQRLSSIYMAFSHGRNDAQKPMGVMTMALAVYFGWETVQVPTWVILSIGVVAGLGVAVGGWRIIHTLGMKITSMNRAQGFAAETAAATALEIATQFGIPVSTTHTITSAIIGAGTVQSHKHVRWQVVGEIVQSWLLTLPVTVSLGYAYAAAIHWLLN